MTGGHHPRRRFRVDDHLLGGAGLLQQIEPDVRVSGLVFDLAAEHESGERHDLDRGLVAEESFESVEVLDRLVERDDFGSSLVDAAGVGEGDAASVVPQAVVDLRPLRIGGFGKDVLPHAETDEGVPLAGRDAVGGHRERLHERRRNLGPDRPRRGDRLAATALHGRGPGQEVSVVRHVDAVLARVRIAFEPLVVEGGRPSVAFRGVVVAAGLHPDVRRHVHEVAGGGNEVDQAIGGRLREFGPRGGLHGVDVEMVGAGMLRILTHHAFEDRPKLRGAIERLAVEAPVRPGLEGDHRLRGPGLDVGVEREGLGDLPHLGEIGLVLFGEILGHRVLVPRHQRFDQRLIRVAFASPEIEGLLRGGVGPLVLGRDDRGVVLVGARRVGDAPPGHREVGVVAGRLHEGGDRPIEVVAVHQGEALVEPASRLLGLGRDRASVGAEPFEDHRRGGHARVRKRRGR